MKRKLVLIVGLLCLAGALYFVPGVGRVGPQTVNESHHIDEVGRAGSADEDTSREGARPEDSAGVRKEVLASGAIYTLSIIDLDEKPVAGLELRLGTGRAASVVRTDRAGRCKIRPSMEGEDELAVELSSSDWALVDLMDQKLVKSIRLPADAKTLIRLRVHGLLALEGRVVDSQGMAKAGAEVLLMCNRRVSSGPLYQELTLAPRSAGHLLAPVQSDEQGRFRLSVPVGNEVTGVQARLGPKWRSEVATLLTWRKNPKIQIELRLIELARIVGSVRSTTPKPPRYLSLTLSRSPASSGKATGPSSDKAGDRIVTMINIQPDKPFALEDLLPGTYRVELKATDNTSQRPWQQSTKLQLHAGETRKLELVIAPRPASKGDITGVVLDQNGRKIEGMSVTAWRAGVSPLGPSSPQGDSGFVGRTRSDAQGRFLIAAKHGSEVLLRTGRQARRSGPFDCFDPIEKKVMAGEKNVRLEVQTQLAGIIQGRIFFPDGRTPKPFPQIIVALQSPAPFGPTSAWRVDPESGSFVMKHLSPGEYEIRVNCSGYQYLSRKVTVHAGQTTPALLQLENLAALRGCVVDAGGHPIAGAMLWVNVGAGALQARGFKNPSATTNAGGWFELAGFRKWGSYIVAYKSGYAPETRLVKTKEESQSLRLVLRKEGGLYVRHLPVTGKAFGLTFDKALLYHLNLKLVDPITSKIRDIQWLPYSPEQPNLLFKKIPAGDYRLLLQVLPPKRKKDAPLPSLWRRVQVQPGDTTTVDWRKLSK